jgi:hypothetical protein
MPNLNIPKKYLLIILVALMSLLVFITVLLGNKTAKKTSSEPETKNTRKTTQNYQPQNPTQFTYNPPDKIIARVGEENIYQKDLDAELDHYPTKDDAAKKLLLNKIIEDSKLLQEAKKENLLPIDNTIYNSPEKDYMGRIGAISKIKIELAKKNIGLKGSIISIWFLNDHVGPLGYEKAKALALKKITYLHTQVKSGNSTMEQVAENIRNDTSLAQLDANYKNNAIFSFNVTPDKTITWEKEFDKMLWELNAGEISDIFTAVSPDFDNNNKVVPAYYMFGTVTDKLKETVTPASETNYEVTYF